MSGGTTLNIQQADGTAHQIDLSGAKTIQDVIDAINGLGNPNLSASLNLSGNGITVTDVSVGTIGFSIEANEIGIGLGIAG